MNSRDAFLAKHKGRKSNRKETKNENSIISIDDEEYILLAGKERKGQPSTILGVGEYGRVKQAQDAHGKLFAVKVFNLEKFESSKENVETEFKFLSRKHQGENAPKLIVVDQKAYLLSPIEKGEVLITADGMQVLDSWGPSKLDEKSGYLPKLGKAINNAADELERTKLIIKYAQVIVATIEAVSKMHQQGIYHTDLHPANILYDETTKIATPIDYGSAELIENLYKKYRGDEVEQRLMNDFKLWLSNAHSCNLDNQKDSIKEFQQTLSKAYKCFIFYSGTENLNLGARTERALYICNQLIDKLEKKLSSSIHQNKNNVEYSPNITPSSAISTTPSSQNTIINYFSNPKKDKRYIELEKLLATASKNGEYPLDEELGCRVKQLLKNPNQNLSMACCNLLLNKAPNILSPGSWAEVAKISINHAKLILDQDNIAKNILEKGFLPTIADGRPEHAKFILNKFNNLPEDQKEIIKYFVDETPPQPPDMPSQKL